MALRCKPGDLAVIVGYSPVLPHLTGRLVEVIHAAPVGVGFHLPDGRWHRPDVSPGEWVIRFMAPVDLRAVNGSPAGRYGVCRDGALFPIRDPGEDAQDETLRWLDVPQKVEA